MVKIVSKFDTIDSEPKKEPNTIISIISAAITIVIFYSMFFILLLRQHVSLVE